MVPINLSGGGKKNPTLFQLFSSLTSKEITLYLEAQETRRYKYTERHQAMSTVLTHKLSNSSLGCKTDAVYVRQLTTFPLCDGNWKYPGRCFTEERHLVTQGLGMGFSCRQLSQHIKASTTQSQVWLLLLAILAQEVEERELEIQVHPQATASLSHKKPCLKSQTTKPKRKKKKLCENL